MTEHDIDEISLTESETLASKDLHFPLVRVIEKNGTPSIEVWRLINKKRGKQHDVMAELAGPRVGNAPPEQRRQSVTWDRIVFVEEDGEPR